MAHPIKLIIEKNRAGEQAGLFSVCSANEMVLRGAIRHAAAHGYPLIIESTSNQVNQFGGYTGILPGGFKDMVFRIAREEGMPHENLILGGDHLGPLLWQHENEADAMAKAVDMVKAYTQAGFSKIHLDTSMKLADDHSGPLDTRICARRGAVLAKAVYETFDATPGLTERPVLVIGSEVPVPGGSKEHEDSVTPTGAEDFLYQVEVYREEFQKEGISFDDVAAFVVQPGVEFGDDFVCFYDSFKAASLTGALKTVPSLAFEGHSTDYQSRKKLTEMVADGIAILKVGPALTFALREGLFLLESIEEIISSGNSPSGFKKALLEEMNKSDQYWKKYYNGTAAQVEFKKLYSYSDRCRYYFPAEKMQSAMERLFRNIPAVPPALISQFFPAQYRRFMEGKLGNDPLSLLCDRIGDVCADYAGACGYIS